MRRGDFLWAVGATALLGAPSLAGRAEAAAPDADLAYARLLVGVELLKLDFGKRALRSGRAGRQGSSLLHRGHAADGAHYRALAALLGDAGEPPAAAGDIHFSYPRGSFASSSAIAERAWKLAALAQGAYLGAIENVATPAMRLPLGQIAANEAQQLSALARLVGRPDVGQPFAAALRVEAVSSALDRYES